MRSGPMHTPWFLNHITSHRIVGMDHHHRRLIHLHPSIHPSPARTPGRTASLPRARVPSSLSVPSACSLSPSPSPSAIMSGMTGASIYDTLLAPASDNLGLCSSAQ